MYLSRFQPPPIASLRSSAQPVRHTALSKPGQFLLGSSSCLSVGPRHYCSSRQVLLIQVILYPSPSHLASPKAHPSLPLSLGRAWGGMASAALSLCLCAELPAGIFPGNCCPQSPAERTLGVLWTQSLSLRVPAGLCWAAPAPHLSLLVQSVSETLRVLLPDHPASSGEFLCSEALPCKPQLMPCLHFCIPTCRTCCSPPSVACSLSKSLP